MRRTIAHSLLFIFIWMLVAPLLAPGGDANLPACCRRNGKHHCMMRGMEQFGAKTAGFTSVSEKCPCIAENTGAVHSPKFTPEATARFHADVVFHPPYAPETSARFRILFLRSHQRRGPPSPLA